ncbi:diguanylate cyclase [Methylobacterium fujisawaense]|uniref:PAS domain-containing protein n=1 Tax=Methylobacterium fujisawaense TaxID=107400 RepID=UPI002F313250
MLPLQKLTSPSIAQAFSIFGIGTWERDFFGERVHGDAIMANIFGLTQEEASAGVSLARFAAAFHPEDRAEGEARRQRAMQDGGIFVVEHRTVPAPGTVRWVMARGHYERDDTGRVVRVRGTLIDVTDSRIDGQVEGQACFVQRSSTATAALERMAEHMLEVWQTADKLEPEQAGRLRPLIQLLLHELGGQLVAKRALDQECRASRR